MTSELPKISVAETLSLKIAALKPGGLPALTMRKCEDLLIDVTGLCVTARNEDYIKSALAGRSMPARWWCRLCWPHASGTIRTAARR